MTTVWTTRAGDAEWIGLRIDFDAMRNQRHFRTPRLTRPKNDPSYHGTEVTVESLKIEQRQWFSKPTNRSNLKRELSRAYSAMLRPGGVPINFRLHLNNQAVSGKQHCIWGADGGVVARLKQIDTAQCRRIRLLTLNCRRGRSAGDVGSGCPRARAPALVAKLPAT